MDLLALVNRTRLECGVSSAALTALTNLPSEDQRILNWVTEAWHDLQIHKPDWLWMKKSFSFLTVDSQYQYTPTQAGLTDLADYKRDSFRCYTTASAFADEQMLPYMDNDVYRNLYQFGSMRTVQGRPMVFTVEPGDKSVKLGPLPTAGYTVLGDYYRTPTDLTLATDDPSSAGNDLPARWHMLLVWMAAQSYAAYEAAPEVKQRADEQVARMMSRLIFDQVEVEFGLPLA